MAVAAGAPGELVGLGHLDRDARPRQPRLARGARSRPHAVHAPAPGAQRLAHRVAAVEGRRGVGLVVAGGVVVAGRVDATGWLATRPRGPGAAPARPPAHRGTRTSSAP